jgi:hypothetical protein
MINKGESDARSLFEKGNFKIALLGNNSFFIEDNLWGGHDSLSVWFYLLNWLQETGSIDRVKQVKHVVQEIFNESIEVCDIDGSLIPIFIVRTYCIAASEENHWPLEQIFIIDLLHNYLENFSEEEAKRFNIERDMKELKEKFLFDL